MSKRYDFTKKRRRFARFYAKKYLEAVDPSAFFAYNKGVMCRKRLWIKILFCALTTLISVLIAAWIFSNSLETGTVSAGKSETVTENVQDAVGVIAPSSPIATAKGEDFDRLHTFVRKCAHFLEFALLGASLTLTLFSYTRFKRFYFLPVAVAFLVAATDEYLQSRTAARGSTLFDVLLDTGGATAGFLFALGVIGLVFLILKKRKKRKSE